jgi:RNA polymerase sigma-70 factor (ECF subfamily)
MTAIALPSEAVETNELVSRHLSGDTRAFGELVGRYHGRLLNFTHRMIGDRERAEDLVQEAFVRVSRHLHRFDQSRKFSTWVYTIASNLAKNELRSHRRSPLVFYQSARAPGDEDHSPLQYEDARGRPDDMFAGRRLSELVESTLARMSPQYCQVLVLREFEGRSYDEIAAIVGCNLGAVKSRLHRARASFANLIRPHLD